MRPSYERLKGALCRFFALEHFQIVWRNWGADCDRRDPLSPVHSSPVFLESGAFSWLQRVEVLHSPNPARSTAQKTMVAFHKFKIGQRITYRPDRDPVLFPCIVTALLPEKDGEFKYRIRRSGASVDIVVGESELRS